MSGSCDLIFPWRFGENKRQIDQQALRQKSDMMSAQEVFAANLKRLIDESPLSVRDIADQAGVSQRTLSRWLQVGVKKADRRSRKPLLQVCRLLGVQLDDLWAGNGTCRCEEYARKVKELISRWERLGLEYGSVTDWIDRCYTAAHVAERFRQEEPELAEVVAKVKSLKSERELYGYLEGMVRDWNLEEVEAVKRLVETTQKFLAAALPRDPDQLGGWFKQAHPRRWAKLLARRKLDNEGELIAFIRHMMVEGLSPHEAYEGLIRLSN
jgi:tape measure domain-containing protein